MFANCGHVIVTTAIGPEGELVAKSPKCSYMIMEVGIAAGISELAFGRVHPNFNC